MATHPQKRKMTVEEYFQLDSDPTAKYEYIEGYAVAMSGGSVGHARIAKNIVRHFDRRLQPGPCQAHTSDVRVFIPANGSYLLPDVSVSCEAQDDDINAQGIRSPRLIVEALSHSTEADDRGDKFLYYRTLTSLQECVLVSSRYQYVEVYRRQPDETWSYQTYRPDAVVELQCLGIQFTFAEIYDQVPVPAKLEMIKELQARYNLP